MRYGDRSCLVTDIKQDKDGKYLYLLPAGNTQHLMVSEHRWDRLAPDTTD